MRVFVAGATGVVGRRVVPMLLHAGHDVTAVAHSIEKGPKLAREGAHLSHVSLFDRPHLRGAVAGHDVVINLATHIPPSAARMMWRRNWRENDHLRREGAAALVEAAQAGGVQRFIQESFAPIYADHGDDWIDEAWPVRPARYNRSVLDAERAVQGFSGVGIVLRFAAFYGADAPQLAEMIRLVRHGWAPLPGPPDSFISSVSHDDAATAVMAALEAPAGVYNVVDDQPVRHRQFVDALADAVGAHHPRLPPTWLTPLSGSLGRTLARSLRITNRKLRDTGAWAPRYPSVREGFPPAIAAMAP